MIRTRFMSFFIHLPNCVFWFSFERYRDDFGPLVEGCGCYCCKNHQRAYLHHLLVTNELLASVLLMIHNTAHYLGFFSALREALAADQLHLLRRRILSDQQKEERGDEERRRNFKCESPQN